MSSARSPPCSNVDEQMWSQSIEHVSKLRQFEGIVRALHDFPADI